MMSEWLLNLFHFQFGNHNAVSFAVQPCNITRNCKLVQITVDLCSLNYIRPMPLFSKEKLRKHVLRIVKENEY